MKVITFFNNKGGVGKTTLAVNIASYLSTHFEKRILFLDADPQANSTQMMIPSEEWLEFYGESATGTTLLNYLEPIEDGDASLSFAQSPLSKNDNNFNVDLIPGHPRLSIIEDNLSDAWSKCLSGELGGFRRTNWLKALIKHYHDEYDYLIVDVGPSLGALNRSVLLNTDYIVTPMGSDIFSLIGISNISSWLESWLSFYENGLEILYDRHSKEKIENHAINLNTSETTKLVGFSIQQYVTRTFTTGRRPIAAYDSIIKQIPETIMKELDGIIQENLDKEDLNLGDVPYLYSLVPLAQSNHAPMYSLNRGQGVRGQQPSQVKKYEEMLNNITTKILKNIGDENDY